MRPGSRPGASRAAAASWGDRSRLPSACAGSYPRPDGIIAPGGSHRRARTTPREPDPHLLAVAGRPSARYRAAGRRLHCLAPSARRHRASCCRRRPTTGAEPGIRTGRTDHPPLATYAIWFTTHARADGLRIKSAAVLWAGAGTSCGRASCSTYGDRRLGVLAARRAQPRAPDVRGLRCRPDARHAAVFAWTGALWCVWRLSETGDGRWWSAAACSSARRGSASIRACCCCRSFFSTCSRRHASAIGCCVRSRGSPPLALAVFTPVLWWNAQHEWSPRVPEQPPRRARWAASSRATS